MRILPFGLVTALARKHPCPLGRWVERRSAGPGIISGLSRTRNQIEEIVDKSFPPGARAGLAADLHPHCRDPSLLARAGTVGVHHLRACDNPARRVDGQGY